MNFFLIYDKRESMGGILVLNWIHGFYESNNVFRIIEKFLESNFL